MKKKIHWLDESKIRSHYLRNEKERKADLAYIPPLLGRFKSVIDFGGSCGYLLDLLKAEVKILVDIDPQARKIAKKKGYQVFKDIKKSPQVEVITMVDVLEHLSSEEFLELLPWLNEKLAIGGKLFIQTINPYCFLAPADFWNDFSHKRMWGPRTLMALLEASGFKVINQGYYTQIGFRRDKKIFLIRMLLFSLPHHWLQYNYYLVAKKIK